MTEQDKQLISEYMGGSYLYIVANITIFPKMVKSFISISPMPDSV